MHLNLREMKMNELEIRTTVCDINEQHTRVQKGTTDM